MSNAAFDGLAARAPADDRRNGWTPLMEAAEAALPDRVSAALQSGSDPNAQGAGGWSAVALAAVHGARSCVDILAPISSPSLRTDGGATALIWAARMGRAECVLSLLGHSDVDAQDDDGRTALAWALAGGRRDAARFLAVASDLSRVGPRGETPLALAARGGDAETLRMLLAAGESPGRRRRFSGRELAAHVSTQGATPLMLAAESGNPEAVAVLAPVSNLFATDSIGGTALTRAAAGGKAQALRALIELRSGRFLPGEATQALIAATDAGSVDCVALLLPHCRTPLEA